MVNEMKKYLLLLAIFSLLFTACQQKPIGNEKDEYGCLSSAGYSWDNDIAACIRQWELGADEKEAAKLVVLPMSIRPVTIIGVDKLACENCYSVKISSADPDYVTAVMVINGTLDFLPYI